MQNTRRPRDRLWRWWWRWWWSCCCCCDVMAHGRGGPCERIPESHWRCCCRHPSRGRWAGGANGSRGEGARVSACWCCGSDQGEQHLFLLLLLLSRPVAPACRVISSDLMSTFSARTQLAPFAEARHHPCMCCTKRNKCASVCACVCSCLTTEDDMRT